MFTWNWIDMITAQSPKRIALIYLPEQHHPSTSGINTSATLVNSNWIVTFSEVTWIWLTEAKRKKGHTAEWKAHIKKQRERHSESDIGKGRARYRAAKRRKASLETESQIDTGLWKMRKKQRERESERRRELNFICFSPNRVWKVCCRAFFFTPGSSVNHTVQVQREDFKQNHTDTRGACFRLWKLTEKQIFFNLFFQMPIRISQSQRWCLLPTDWNPKIFSLNSVSP